jgi:hypothetical protein
MISIWFMLLCGAFLKVCHSMAKLLGLRVKDEKSEFSGRNESAVAPADIR